MEIQTDFNSFSFGWHAVVPWCKRCGIKKVVRDGKYKNKQRYKCNRCGFRFVFTSDLPKRRSPSHDIIAAVEFYTSNIGASLRTVARKLLEWFGTKISHEGVRQWVLACATKVAPRVQPAISDVWHIDETYIKIKGMGHWLWIVECARTRAVLAWHLSKARVLPDAIAVLKKAKQNAGVRPYKIITDGLWQYVAAIKIVMGWNYRDQKQRHIIDSGIGKNALIERLNREVKRRTKWFSTFQDFHCAELFFNLFFYHYNQTPKRCLGMTPLTAASCKEKSLKDYLFGWPSPNN